MIYQDFRLAAFDWVLNQILVAVPSLQYTGDELTIGCHSGRKFPVGGDSKASGLFCLVIINLDIAAVYWSGVVRRGIVDQRLRWMKRRLVIVTFVVGNI